MTELPRPMVADSTELTDTDVYLFRQGTHTRLHEKMGSHQVQRNGQDGVQFRVWAPNAERLSVIGDFNDWDAGRHPLQRREDGSGIWEGFIAHVQRGASYKYRIESYGRAFDKGDPYARLWEA